MSFGILWVNSPGFHVSEGLGRLGYLQEVETKVFLQIPVSRCRAFCRPARELQLETEPR